PVRRTGPAVVEDELALTVALHVERTGADQLFAVPERQMLRQPARLRGDAARLLEPREPVPFEKRRPRADERVPRRPRDLAQGREDADLGHAIVRATCA